MTEESTRRIIRISEVLEEELDSTSRRLDPKRLERVVLRLIHRFSEQPNFYLELDETQGMGNGAKYRSRIGVTNTGVLVHLGYKIQKIDRENVVEYATLALVAGDPSLVLILGEEVAKLIKEEYKK